MAVNLRAPVSSLARVEMVGLLAAGVWGGVGYRKDALVLICALSYKVICSGRCEDVYAGVTWI